MRNGSLAILINKRYFCEKIRIMTAVVAQEQERMTIEEYLELEERSQTKHEYVKGQITPMPGGTLKHNIIASNIVTALNIAIRQLSKSFIVSNSDTKIWIPVIETFYYPDAVVICEVPAFYKGRKDVVLNPLLIVAVSSSSTEAHDRGTKVFDYAALPSLQEYLIIRHDYPMAHLSNRTETDDWRLRSVEHLDQSIELLSIGCSISMHDVYDKTENL